MQRQPLAASQRDRIAAGLPFVESLARRVASSMPHSIDLGDLVQDGMLGLIDAAHRFDEARGHQVRDLRRAPRARRDDRRAPARCLAARRPPPAARARSGARRAAPRARRRAVARRPRRACRHRRSAARPHHRPHQHHRVDVAAVGRRERRQRDAAGGAGAVRADRRPTRPTSSREVRDRVRAAIAVAAAARAQGRRLYYYAEATMKQIGDRDRRQRIARLAAARARDPAPEEGARRRSARRRTPRAALRPAILSFQQTMRARWPGWPGKRRGRMSGGRTPAASALPVLDAARRNGRGASGAGLDAVCRPETDSRVGDLRAIRAPAEYLRAVRSRSLSRNGFASQRQPVSSRKRSASVPATSPVTKMIRRAICGVVTLELAVELHAVERAASSGRR